MLCILWSYSSQSRLPEEYKSYRFCVHKSNTSYLGTLNRKCNTEIPCTLTRHNAQEPIKEFVLLRVSKRIGISANTKLSYKYHLESATVDGRCRELTTQIS